MAGEDDEAPLVIVLHEEVPEVTLRVVLVERVVLRRRTVRGSAVVRAELTRRHAAVVVSREPEG